MNIWVEKSIEFINAPGYLDRLTQVYPAIPSPRRPLSEAIRERITTLQKESKGLETIRLLLELEGHPFPIEHPYVSVLRERPDLLYQNPKVVGQITQVLFSLEAAGIIQGCERPPDLNRQMGPRFKNWLRNYFRPKGFAFLPEHPFDAYQGKAFLDASDTKISEYANKMLGCRINRGRDFLAKIGDRFVIGEARFLSSGGGSQSRDIRETVNFAKDKIGNVIKVAVLDGMVWFDTGMLEVIKSLEDDEPGLTALLLEDFLESLG